MNTMMDEVLEQPSLLAGLRKYYESPGAISGKALRKLAARWPPTVVFTGMGSSLYAAYPAQAYLNARGIRAVAWETAELVHHHLRFLGPDTLLVAVSQSGETIEIRQLLKQLPPKMGVAAVVNVEASTLARRSTLLLPMMAGGQESVSTKTYVCSVAVLMYLAFAIAEEPHRHLTQALLRAVEAEEQILENHDVTTPPTVEFFNHPTYVSLMSRGPDLSSAYQGAMMLKEVARVAAEPTSAAQFRHGPIEIVNPNHRYVIFARHCDLSAAVTPRKRSPAATTGQLLLKLARDIQHHGGRVLLLTDLPFTSLPNVRAIVVESMPLGLGTLIDSLYIQLLAHELAVRAGLEPGKFWIAEGVTTEE